MSLAGPPPLIDTHAHLTDRRFHGDLEQVLERAWQAGLQAVVCVGYDLASSRQAVALAHSYPGVFATVGIHPNWAAQAGPADLAEIAALADSTKVVGIGETGLDYYRAFSPPQLQEEYLLRHLELAAEHGLPVVVHNREASARLTELLLAWTRDVAERTAVLHCFSGDRSMLERCAAAGLYISFAGTLTFPKAHRVVDAAGAVPAERMVVETDAPYLAPVPFRGRRNEPAFVVHTARRLAELRQAPYDAVAEAVRQNSLRLFPRLKEVAS